MRFLISMLCAALMTTTTHAQDDLISAQDREAAIAELGQLIEENYFDAEAGARFNAELQAFANGAEANNIEMGNLLAGVLTDRLQPQDRHFDIRWRGVDEIAMTRAQWAAEDAAAAANTDTPDRWTSLRRRNFSFADVSVLNGNIGYLNLTGFAPIEPAERTARAALDFIANTETLIIDLRENGGGSPDMVQYLLSHFLPAGEERLYNTFLPRHEARIEMRTLAEHPAGNRPDVPLYILVSPDSLSAAEALAYHLQTMGRARIIGELTAGGGNPGEIFLASSGYSIFIPTATSVSPLTGTNWDGEGVQPDITVPAVDALDRALLEINRHIAATAQDPSEMLAADWQVGWLGARLTPWQPDAAALEAFVGQYGPRRVWLENGRLMYQREGREVNELIPMVPGTFRFANSEDYLVDFPGWDSGRAAALVIRLETAMTEPSPREA